MNLLKENKNAILFLLVFVGLYVILNTLYGLYIRHALPGSDVFTRVVTGQVVWFLSLFDPSVVYYPSALSEYIPVANDHGITINVFEGCNGLNVMIVYVSFLLAFSGPRRELIKFVLVGVVAIHAINLLRVGLLYGVALYFPQQLYFFHKYFFTGMIYLMVFVLWFHWVKRVRAERPVNEANPKEL